MTIMGRSATLMPWNDPSAVKQGLLKDVENPFEYIRGQAVLGSESFMERVQRLIRKHGVKDRHATGSVRRVSGVGVEEVLKAVGDTYAVPGDELRQARARCREARQVALYVMATHSRGRLTGREIGEAMGGITTSAVTQAKARVERKQKRNRAFRQRIAAILKSIVSP